MTLIDDSTRFCYIYLLKSKDEALHYFKMYKVEVENQLERKIKRCCPTKHLKGTHLYESDY